MSVAEYEKQLARADAGTYPLYSPEGYMAEERSREKQTNKKFWYKPHFLIGLSKHFLLPPTSSGASYLTLGKVSGGAPPIL